MAINIEIKARMDDLDSFGERALHLGARGPMLLKQTDTFFRCPFWRLKLREEGERVSEVIIYGRQNISGPKPSRYVRVNVGCVGTIVKRLLSLVFGISVTVRKTRRLYLLGDTRIHSDMVEGLGTFIELEVVLNTQTREQGAQTANCLMQDLFIKEEDLVNRSYCDLLSEQITAVRNGRSNAVINSDAPQSGVDRHKDFFDKKNPQY